jgi:hypothetical protein
MFSLLSEDLIEHSRHIGSFISPLEFVLRRLSSWRHLLERGSDSLLSLSSVRGLCGELVCLDVLIDQLGCDKAVNAWVGPLGADQDFQLGSTAWEVKTIRPDAETVHIASESQLDATNSAIDLVLVEFVDVSNSTDGGFTLNFQVSKLRQKLSASYGALLQFDNLMLIAGYVVKEEYEGYCFKLKILDRYAVVDDFPCVVRSTIPVGIKNVCYEIELKALGDFLTERTSF